VPRSRLLWRLLVALLVAISLSGAIYLWRTGNMTPTAVKDWLDSLGPAAPALFIAAMIAGAFLGLPGMVFVIGGRLAFGPYVGFVVGYVGGLLAVTAPFLTARLLRRAVAEPMKPKNRWVARAFAQVEHHPVRSVLIMRLIVWFNAPLSYALALTEIRVRDYVLACALALAPVVALAMIATGWFM
jgi:uncharacterized membrane protein YdjX (TVP38/TMEM64 family)